MDSGLLVCFDSKTMHNFVIESMYEIELDSHVTRRLLEDGDIPLYAEEIWEAWAGDTAPEPDDKKNFSTWLGPELGPKVIAALPADFWTQE